MNAPKFASLPVRPGQVEGGWRSGAASRSRSALALGFAIALGAHTTTSTRADAAPPSTTAGAEPVGVPAESREKHSTARELLVTGPLGEAGDALVALWRQAGDAEWSAYRRTALLPDIRTICRAHFATRTIFAAESEALRRGLTPASGESLNDWLALQWALGDDAGTVRWFDGVKADIAWAEALQTMRSRMAPAFARVGRWADMPHLFPAPQAWIDDHLQPPLALEAVNVRDVKNLAVVTESRILTAWLAAGLCAQKREAEAEAVCRALIHASRDGGTRRIVVETALSAKQSRSYLLALIDEGVAKGELVADLRTSVRRALEAAPAKPAAQPATPPDAGGASK